MATSGMDLRPRRGTTAAKERAPSQDEKKNRGEDKPEERSSGIGWKGAFCFLMVARYYSAIYNNIHDCDEVFNYWEPLHYLLYKSGFQTWEYNCTGPFMLLSYAGVTKVQVFFSVRLALGLVSASTEVTLVDAANRKFGARVGVYTLMFLCVNSGCFNASTSFLPSTFAMYAITLASALVLLGDWHKTDFGCHSSWRFCRLALCSSGCCSIGSVLIIEWRLSSCLPGRSAYDVVYYGIISIDRPLFLWTMDIFSGEFSIP